MEISLLKNMIPKIKHSLDELNGRMEMTKIKQYKFSNLNNREEND